MNAPEPISSNPSDFASNLAAVLGAENAARLTVLSVTPELRWDERWGMAAAHTSVCTRVLQQRWVCNITGRSEWRDVPVVGESEY